MKRKLVLAVVLGLSGSLFLMAGEQAAQADPPIKDLSGVTQNWDKNLPSAARFTVLHDFNNQAVRDNNTGLVWERVPDATIRVWSSISQPLGARNYCVNKNVGGTRGWRLPSVAELESLIDPSLPPPFVPPSVFSDVLLAHYWSATTVADGPTLAWVVAFFGDDGVFGSDKTNGSRAWCVRGGMNADAY